MKKTIKKKLGHYLVSVPFPGGYGHGYVITNDDRIIAGVAEKIVDQAKGFGLECWGLILSTGPLDQNDEAVNLIREIISKNCGDEPAKHWRKVPSKDKFHLTAWFMSGDHPDTKRLMDIH
jgi:hypothetical protein